MSDHYVGAMKGAILREAPDAALIDLTHSIPPQDIARGAFEFDNAHWTFPDRTIHVAVVDPGVGTGRKALAFHAEGHTFIGPDNGLLSLAAIRHGGKRDGAHVVLPHEGVALDWRRVVKLAMSATFHGRDLFAPVAGRIARGVPIHRLGTPIDRILALPDSDQHQVIAIDRFGNVISNFRPQPGTQYRVTIKDTTVTGLHRTYADKEGLIALIGSTGLLEIAVSNGNAAERLNVSIGEAMSIDVIESKDSQ